MFTKLVRLVWSSGCKETLVGDNHWRSDNLGEFVDLTFRSHISFGSHVGLDKFCRQNTELSRIWAENGKNQQNTISITFEKKIKNLEQIQITYLQHSVSYNARGITKR